jgi:hypothetical protein
MASKIQLRRDLAASWVNINPILAQGEPGAELDTGKMKLGDGVTAWNQLPYTSSNDYEDKFVFLFSDGSNYAAGTSTSLDGLHWTGVDTTSEFWNGNYESTYAYNLAVGNGRVAYLAYNYITDANVVLFSETPGSAIVDPNWTRFLEEQGANIQRSWVSYQDFNEYLFNDFQNQNWATMVGPNGEGINWHSIKFQGGYFIAIGSYYDDNIDDDRNRPYWVYSTDAVHWTRGYVDLPFVTSKMDAYADAHDYSNYAIKDVNYNGSGWLFTMKYEWNTYNNDSLTGGFYLTNLSNGFNNDSWFPMNGAYSMNFDGKGWGGYMGSGYMLFSSNTDPRVGGWREVDVGDAQQSVWGDNAYTDWNDSRSFVAGPLADGTPMFMVALSNGRVLITTDQGQYFSGSTPAARVDAILDWDNQSPAEILTDYENNSGNTGIQQVVITGSLNGQANGTFYAQQYDDNSYKLYYDYALTNPVNATGWTNSNLFNDAYITFTQQGIELTNPVYGGGKFVAFSSNSDNNYMTEDGFNWKYGWGWNVVNDNDLETETIAYGRVSTDGQIVVNDETYPGSANSLTLGNNFDVQVNSGDPLSYITTNGGDGFEFSDGTGYLSVRPYNAQWRIGAYGRSNGPEGPYSFIGSDDYYDYFDGPDYRNQPADFPGGPDVRITTYWSDWYFTSDPTQNYSQLIMSDTADIVTVDQESFLKDTPRSDLGNTLAYTLTRGDRGRFLWLDGTGGNSAPGDTNPVVTIPINTSVDFPIGTRIQLIISGQTNANLAIQLTPVADVTLIGRESGNSSRISYGPSTPAYLVSDTLYTLMLVDTNYWVVSGTALND